jgi:predicted alpha/beta hydrolase family esterase
MEIWQMDYPVLVVPGIGNSGPLHWQSVWQAAHPDWQRLAVEDWDYVVCDDWVSAIERQLAANGRETVIAAHSLGCLAVVHWAARYARKIRGVLLVAVPDPASPAFPRVAASGFAPLPSERLPFPTTVVSSTNDPYGSVDHARTCAAAWGSELVEVGAKGHLNADSNLGNWPEGFRLLEKMNNG